MSVVPLMSALMPVPEPPPVTWMVVSLCFFMYSSAQRCPSTTIVSEPLMASVPAEAIAGVSDRVASAAAAMNVVLIRMSPCPFDSCCGSEVVCRLERDAEAEQELVLVLELRHRRVVPAEV